ncbi:MAG: hypothetical protein CVV44_09855 [Spirochaetae bacterium HGW-Spirochaetae-1]|jgi:uncharacterized protein (DUF362 family)|nr:MAG: hypothetical protein CVV44_09855 [Spirochaetae bacterium HGW-Spirochaetae-1]
MKNKTMDGKYKRDEKTDILNRPGSGLTTRRDFLLSAASGAAAIYFSSCADSNQSNKDSIPVNRVVRVIDSDATSWNGVNPDDFYQYTDQDAVDAMVGRGVRELAGKSTDEEAWRSLVPYNNGEMVMIHLNAYNNNDNSRKNNVAAPISAVIYGLVDLLGIPASNIVISDPSRTLAESPAEDRIINVCRHKSSISWDLYQGEYGSDITFTSGHEPSSAEKIARAIDEADHIILMPVLSWHSSGMSTGAMKMMIGSLDHMLAMHDCGPGDWRNSAGLADICMPIKEKLRLIVADGLFGNINGNTSSPHAFITLGGASGTGPSSTLYLSKDIVALDSVMYDDLLDEATAQGSPKSGYLYGYLKFAADSDHNLGTFEMRDETDATAYSKINLVKVNLT